MNPDLVSVFADIIKDQNGLRYTSSVDIDRAPANSTECASNWLWTPQGPIRSNWTLKWDDTTTSDTPMSYSMCNDLSGAPGIKKYDPNNDLRILLMDEPEPIKASTEELQKRMSAFADEIFE